MLIVVISCRNESLLLGSGLNWTLHVSVKKVGTDNVKVEDQGVDECMCRCALLDTLPARHTNGSSDNMLQALYFQELDIYDQ